MEKMQLPPDASVTTPTSDSDKRRNEEPVRAQSDLSASEGNKMSK